MDLNLIRLFVAIVDVGSMSAAAHRLAMTRSHVSRRLQQLERSLGVQLIRRTTRRLDLTEEGRTLYEHGARMMGEMESARYRLQQGLTAPSGHVRLSVPTGLGQLELVPQLLDFARQHTDMTLRVQFSNRVDDLLDAEVDVALRVMSEPPVDCVAREVRRVTWALCATPAYLAAVAPLSAPADLVRADILCPPVARGQMVLRFDVRGQVQAVTVRPRLMSEHFPLLLAAVRAGNGIAQLPDYLVDDDLATGRLQRVLLDTPLHSPGDRLYIVTSPNPYPNTAVRAVVAFLRSALAPANVVDEGGFTPASAAAGPATGSTDG